jgi:hypothetical protein
MLWFEHPVTRADLETAVRERRSEGTERRCVPSSVPFYYSLRITFSRCYVMKSALTRSSILLSFRSVLVRKYIDI